MQSEEKRGLRQSICLKFKKEFNFISKKTSTHDYNYQHKPVVTLSSYFDFFLEKTWKIVISSLITCQFQSMTVKWLAEVDVPDLIDRSRRNPEYDSSNPKDTHRTYVVLCHGFTS